ncbi:tetratricopeptide repeat protein [Balneola sp. MJW-20]|uniref:tetratricopeptide repeat protein n=1 Tax=Gracilimonas aurantiaca TaxID=3234185 RepID=UPI0034653532
MKKLFRNLLLVLLTAGFAVSCQSGDPLVNEAKDAISERNYQGALAATEQALAQNPSNVAALYYKAQAHAEIARQIPEVDARPSDYTKMRGAVETIYSISDTLAEEPAELKLSQDMTINTWAFELNSAVNIVNSDSIMNADPDAITRAVAHLENAAIVNPDSVLTFDIMSQVHYMNNDLASAIEASKKSMSMQDTPAAMDYNRLAAYYMMQPDYESAITVLEESMETYADSVYLVQKLADSYTAVGEIAKATEAIQNLIDDEPNNPQYRLALGTQLYKATDDPNTQLTENYDKLYDLRDERKSASSSERSNIDKQIADLEAQNDELLAAINSYTEQAVEQLQKAAELDPQNITAVSTLGIIYQNNAATYFELRNNTLDNEESNKYDEMAKQELRKAVEYYEKTVELDPDDTETWAALGRAYLTLDMKEKAEAAMEKAGM